MNAFNEIVEYCKEEEPIGALLVTGEWGCGKTYMIEKNLKTELKNSAIIIRVSLFGLDSIEKINENVRVEWINKYCEVNGKEKILKKLRKTGETVSKLEFLPDFIKGFAGTNWLDFVDIKNKIDNQKVVLVFDDLERCRLDNIDVLGVINDYCENQKMNVIVVANQEKIVEKNAEIEGFSYQDVKEKIIQKTIEYLPNYAEVIREIVENAKFPTNDKNYDKYRRFLVENENKLLEIFAPEMDEIIEDATEIDELEIERRCDEKCDPHKQKRPHNIRSLKCAIQDFSRVYKILENNNFDNIDKWMCAFVEYMISYKAGIAVEGEYGTIFSDGEVRKIFPDYQDRFMFQAVKNWILHGAWDERSIDYEVKVYIERERARTPEEIVKTSLIIDVDDDIVEQGFGDVLSLAYEGKLSMKDYLYLIENCYYVRLYKPKLSEKVDWGKINCGINICLKNLLNGPEEDQYIVFPDENYIFKDLDPKELEAYQTIVEFNKNETLMYSENRMRYIEGMENNAHDVFEEIQNRRFNVFDEKMAEVTAQAFAKASNFDKHTFVVRFEKMWNVVFTLCKVDTDKTKTGLTKLNSLLKMQVESLNQNQTFAIFHTNNFINIVKKLQNKL